MSDWELFTAEELRTAAKVAKASGGHFLGGAAAAWEFRADIIEDKRNRMADYLDGA